MQSHLFAASNYYVRDLHSLGPPASPGGPWGPWGSSCEPKRERAGGSAVVLRAVGISRSAPGEDRPPWAWQPWDDPVLQEGRAIVKLPGKACPMEGLGSLWGRMGQVSQSGPVLLNTTEGMKLVNPTQTLTQYSPSLGLLACVW